MCVVQGIEYLINNGLVANTPEDVARFLFAGEGLNKTAIGDYLGEKYVLYISAVSLIYTTESIFFRG
jgi:cytohesin